MAINNISDYTNVSETISALSSSYDQIRAKKAELTTLFEGSFALMGGNSDEAEKIYDEMEELKTLIENLQSQIEAWNKIILRNSEEIGNCKDRMDDLIMQYKNDSDAVAQDARQSFREITTEALDKYARGEFASKAELDNYISNQAIGIRTSVAAPISDIEAFKSAISAKTAVITGLIESKNAANLKVSTAQGALTLLNEMYQMQIIAKGTRISETKGTNGVPVYTQEQEAMIDQWYAKYHSSATQGVDAYSIGNKQLQNMGEALGIKDPNNNTLDAMATGGTSAYTKSEAKLDQADRSNLYQNSILQDMYNAGFTYKEAMYACQYIFGTGANLFSYNTNTNKITIAWGHFTNRADWSQGNYKSDARQVTDSFVNQAQSLWGASPEQVDPDEPGTGGGDDPGAGGGGAGDVGRTDPIGWSVGNVTYDFVIDRDGDGVFDSKNEFLGANNGIAELRALDTNNDGKVTAEEMAAANVYILEQNQNVSGFGISTASDAGIQEIDLSTINEIENSHANVNGKEVKNTFGITFNDGTSVTGYQSLDDNDYLTAVYGERFGKALTAKLDKNDATVAKGFEELSGFVLLDEAGKENAIQNANNIFAEANAKKQEAVDAAQAQERELVAEYRDMRRSTVNNANATEEQNENDNQSVTATDNTRKDLQNRIASYEALRDDMYNANNESQAQYYQAQIDALQAQLDALPTA